MATVRSFRSGRPSLNLTAALIPRQTPSAVFGPGSPPGAPGARDMARRARHARHVGHRRADVLGRDVASAERVDEAAEGFEQLRRLRLARLADDDGLAAAERH